MTETFVQHQQSGTAPVPSAFDLLRRDFIKSRADFLAAEKRFHETQARFKEVRARLLDVVCNGNQQVRL